MLPDNMDNVNMHCR